MKKNTIWAGALLITVCLVLGYYLFFAHNEQIPKGGACKADIECGNLNCKGVGPWYCDKDGSPICGTDRVCTCGFACL
jgi:hypothetical protein